MSNDISPENEEFIRQAVSAGRFQDRQQALDVAVDLLRDEEATLQAIEAGLDSIKQGEGVPLHEADAQLRKKLQIPRDA